jgi:predicted RNA-binding protein YlxR (DUF448 family)
LKKKKIPMRMCIGCREMLPKKELIRVVKNQAGEISIDLKGKAPGRGAYLCRSQECIDKAARNRLLEKTFEQRIDQDVYENLKLQLMEGE